MARLSSADFAQFNDLLASGVETGMGLESAVGLAAAHAGSGKLRQALEGVANSLREGASLPDALERSPGLFPDEYCALLRAACQAGRAGEVLRYFERYAATRALLSARLRTVITYFIAGFLFITGGMGVCLWVANEMLEVYRQIDVPLPGLTLVMLWIGRHPFEVLAVLGSILLLVLGGVWAARLGAFGYRLPVWGEVQKSHDLALFCTTMALRLGSGSSVQDALASVREVLGNRHARRFVARAHREAAEGSAVSEAMAGMGFFPRTLIWAVGLGERRGDLAGTFESFARIYRADVERNLELGLMMLTPLGILVMGNMGFFTVLTLFLPLISLLEGIGKRK